MEIHTVKCDICSTERQASNGWFKVYLDSGTHGGWFSVSTDDEYSAPMHHALNTTSKIIDCCGAKCVTRALSEFLSGITKPPKPTAVMEGVQ